LTNIYGSLGISIDVEKLVYGYAWLSGELGITIDQLTMTIPQQAEITPLAQSLMILIILIFTMWLVKEIIDMFSDLME
jgi:hypothetical protein